MIDYVMNYGDRLFQGLLESIELLLIVIIISLLVAATLTFIILQSKWLSKIVIYIFSIVYAIPSLALFGFLIPITGLGKITAIIVLVIYNQYLLLRNFIVGLNNVDPATVEAALGIGMKQHQIVFLIKLPLAKEAIITGIRLSIISTISISTIAAFINAGGLGVILFDGLRTINYVKIVWGSILLAGLSISLNRILKRMTKPNKRLRGINENESSRII